MQPDYLAFNSMSFSNGANRDTELQVIVYQYWNADEVVAEIEAEHNQINGTPTTLQSIYTVLNGLFIMDMNHFIAPLSIMTKKKKQTVNQKTVCYKLGFSSLLLFSNFLCIKQTS